MKCLVQVPCMLQHCIIDNSTQDLIDGNIVAGIKDFDNRTRILQKYIIKKNPKKMDLIVLGSSRSFYIRKHYFKNEVSFFNHSVGAATLEDYIAFIGIYNKYQKYIPNTIILGIDPWVFNKYNGMERWKYISQYYYYSINLINKNVKAKYIIKTSDLFKQFFVFDKSTSCLYYLNFKNKLRYFITSNTETDDWLIFPDGSVEYPYIYRYTDNEIALNKARVLPHSRVFGLEKFNKLSNIELFEIFINYLLQNNVNLYFFLHPYHPVSYGNFTGNNKYKIIIDVENYLIKLSKSKNIQILGSYNPEILETCKEDYFDKMHGYENVTHKILANSFGNFQVTSSHGAKMNASVV